MLGKVPVNITAAGASPTETSAWEDLEKQSGPSLSPRAGLVLAKTVPSLFAQPVPKTSRDAEPPTGFSDPAAQRLCSTKRQDILISPSWTIFCCLSSKPGFGTNLLLSVFFFTFFFIIIIITFMLFFLDPRQKCCCTGVKILVHQKCPDYV